MKKLLLALAILFSASLVSCGNAATETTTENDSTQADTTLVTDSVPADSVVVAE